MLHNIMVLIRNMTGKTVMSLRRVRVVVFYLSTFLVVYAPKKHSKPGG